MVVKRVISSISPTSELINIQVVQGQVFSKEKIFQYNVVCMYKCEKYTSDITHILPPNETNFLTGLQVRVNTTRHSLNF